jgi:hypothetical protein
MRHAFYMGDIRNPVEESRIAMFDLLYLALGTGLLAAFAWYAFACDRL